MEKMQIDWQIYSISMAVGCHNIDFASSTTPFVLTIALFFFLFGMFVDNGALFQRLQALQALQPVVLLVASGHRCLFYLE